MDKSNKKVSEYYMKLAEVYQIGLACVGCEFQKSTQYCIRNKQYCSERLFITMKRLLGEKNEL